MIVFISVLYEASPSLVMKRGAGLGIHKRTRRNKSWSGMSVSKLRFRGENVDATHRENLGISMLLQAQLHGFVGSQGSYMPQSRSHNVVR